MRADLLPPLPMRVVPGIMPEAATGWLRFGVMALPKTAPPDPFLPF